MNFDDTGTMARLDEALKMAEAAEVELDRAVAMLSATSHTYLRDEALDLRDDIRGLWKRINGALIDLDKKAATKPRKKE